MALTQTHSPTAPATPFDVILSPIASFCDGVDDCQPQYPTFSPTMCGWHVIFERITWPSLLLECCGSGNLGEYPDILILWKSWDKGMAINGVGQKPPLQRVDECWGCHRDTRSKKGCLPAWRSRNDKNVRCWLLSGLLEPLPPLWCEVPMAEIRGQG